MSEPTIPEFWTALDIGLAISLPALLAGSAFFSSAETALFGMNAAQRAQLARSGHTAALSLLRQPRMLLITLLMGNMLINTLYFVISSVLLMRQPWGGWGAALLPLGLLLILVLFGEIAPKMTAASRPVTLSKWIGPPLHAGHLAIGPLRRILDRLIIQPLASLTVSQPPNPLSIEELGALLELSGADGLVDSHEQALLADVLALGNTTVRDVMTPRTRMSTLATDSTAADVDGLFKSHRLMRVPVHGRNRDDIVGILHAKDWARSPGPLTDLARPVLHIPEDARVDLALRTMRQERRQTAIVVDEFGGTAGVVDLQDLIEPIVGEISESTSQSIGQARPMGPGRWIVDGDFPARSLLSVMRGNNRQAVHASSMAGLVLQSLGRPAKVGDHASVGNVDLQVHHVDDAGRIETIIVSTEDNT
ncbi:MAG: hemolysin family protein [Phycisphaerales bacterium]|nr:hemolysin family protein [Phycisphaerales bacterium]